MKQPRSHTARGNHPLSGFTPWTSTGPKSASQRSSFSRQPQTHLGLQLGHQTHFLSKFVQHSSHTRAARLVGRYFLTGRLRIGSLQPSKWGYFFPSKHRQKLHFPDKKCRVTDDHKFIVVICVIRAAPFCNSTYQLHQSLRCFVCVHGWYNSTTNMQFPSKYRKIAII